MSILVKNGHIFTAVDSYVADILVDDGKVRTIGIDLAADAPRAVIDRHFAGVVALILVRRPVARHRRNYQVVKTIAVQIAQGHGVVVVDEFELVVV